MTGMGRWEKAGIISLMGRGRSSPVQLRWNIGELRGGGGGSHLTSGVENISGSSILYLTLGNGEKQSVT